MLVFKDFSKRTEIHDIFLLYSSGACKRHPCLNDGKCEALKSHSKYVCDCTGTGFYGKRCHKGKTHLYIRILSRT